MTLKQRHHWFGFQTYVLKHRLITEKTGSLVAEILRQPLAPGANELESIAPIWLRCLIAQAWHMLQYDWNGVIAAGDQLQALNKLNLPIEVEIEQKFLTVIARSRSDQLELESNFQVILAPYLAQNQNHFVASAFTVERASELLAKGLYREALRAIDGFSDNSMLLEGEANFWKLRYEIVAGICQEAVGEYELSAGHLRRQEAILRQCPHPVLWLAYARRQLSHYIESESLAIADDFRESIEKSIGAVENPALQSMYLDECFRLHVEFGRPQMAEKCFAGQEDAVRLGKIPGTLILLSHERCELALAKYEPEHAARTIINELWWIQKSGSPSAQALAMYALARAHARAGNFEAAFHSGELCLAICEKYNFGRTQVRVTLFLLSMVHRLGNLKLVADFLRQAETRLGKIQLPLHQDLLLVLRFYYCPKQIDWLQEVGRFRDEREFSLLEAWGRSYHFLPGVTGLLAIVEKMMQGEIGFHGSSRALISWVRDQGLHIMDLAHSTSTARLILSLLKHSRQGMTLLEIHGDIWRGSKFQPHRHSARVHSLIKSARRQLAPIGINLNQVDGRYHLVAPKGIFRMGGEHGGESVAKTRRRRALPKYQDSIIAMLRDRPMSGMALASRLRITAQSLHPVLKEMEKSAILRLEKKGRYSLYHLR